MSVPMVWRVSQDTPGGCLLPMTDAEFAQWQADQAATAAARSVVVAPKPPPAANAVLGALAALDPATASVADVVNAVKGALAKAGATAV